MIRTDMIYNCKHSPVGRAENVKRKADNQNDMLQIYITDMTKQF